MEASVACKIRVNYIVATCRKYEYYMVHRLYSCVRFVREEIPQEQAEFGNSTLGAFSLIYLLHENILKTHYR